MAPYKLCDLDFYRQLLPDTFEYCGNFIEFTNGCLVADDITIIKGTISENRGTCQHQKYSQYIWHTHPLSAKAYPSAEDILNVLKHHVIQKSIIFTRWGVWILSCPGKYADLSNPEYYSHALEQVNRIIAQIYFATEHGRADSLNSEAIDAIEQVSNKLSSIYKSLTITFTEWTQIDYMPNGILQFL